VAEACKHTITVGGSCRDCGVKVYDIETRECSGCKHASPNIGWWICRKHLMSIAHDMHVTYKISEGSCFEEFTNG